MNILIEMDTRNKEVQKINNRLYKVKYDLWKEILNKFSEEIEQIDLTELKGK